MHIFKNVIPQESKLDVMVKKIGKLKAVLHGFQKDRSQVNLTKNIFKSINSVVSVFYLFDSRLRNDCYYYC